MCSANENESRKMLLQNLERKPILPMILKRGYQKDLPRLLPTLVTGVVVVAAAAAAAAVFLPSSLPTLARTMTGRSPN